MIPVTVDAPAMLDLALDGSNHYPGELATLYLHFSVPQQAGSMLQLVMPRVMEVEKYILPPGVPATLPSVAEEEQNLIIFIPLLQEYFSSTETYDIQISARLRTFYIDQYLNIEANIVSADTVKISSKEARLAVLGKGSYLQYLPEIYENDDFTSRFLMLFESFWKPINQQIDQVDNYFDPDLTPPAFIPWLSSWLGLPLDSSLPLERMRTLLKNAMMLFQCRGTLQALKIYLEVYTAGEVTILERRATNFVLGPAAGLGMEVALGRDNRPNSVQINLRVAESELSRTQYSRETYQHKIMDVVRTLVPAHVSYDVNCMFE
jgi:phage tail-like protein